jgi:hypothetical protein
MNNTLQEPFNPLRSLGGIADVTVIINAQNNRLTVIDNGMGMPKEVVLKYFFTPHGTLKSGPIMGGNDDVRQRGEKGVGATFLSYGTNYIQLSTKSKETGELTAGLLEDGLNWCNEKRPLLPMPEVKPCLPHDAIMEYEHGTAVTIRFGCVPPV